MSAIERLKAELVDYPIIPGGDLPPILRAAPGALPSALIELLLELADRVEALEQP